VHKSLEVSSFLMYGTMVVCFQCRL